MANLALLSRSSTLKPSSPEHKEQLCKRCSDLDIDTLLAPEYLAARRRRCISITSLGRSNERWVQPFCPLCKLFNKVKPEPSPKDGQNEPQHEEFFLHVIHKDFEVPINAGIWDDRCLSFLGILSHKSSGVVTDVERETFAQAGVIARVDGRSHQGPRLVNAKVDFKLVMSWMGACSRHHDIDCNARVSARHSTAPTYLINCEALKVELALPSSEYAALSYVWGSTKRVVYSPHDQADLPSNLPLTILDAIIVTRNLRIKFLWCDQLCIPQHDKIKQKEQIEQMDIIYRVAEIVLIAAAGKDSDFGLPGVSIRKREPQPRANVGDHVLVSLMSHPRLLVDRSTWNTRGWTYQESYCARRRLVFTEQQVLYQCMQSSKWESFEVDDSPRPNFCYFGRHDVFAESSKMGLFPWDFPRHISSYSTKTLTFDSDALNGILGVLRFFEQSFIAPIQHYWGIPVLPPIVPVPPQMVLVLPPILKAKDEHETFCTISRTFISGFALGLCWTSNVPGRRRPQFPSWTWAGWTAEIEKYFPQYSQDFRHLDHPWEVCIPSIKGALCPFDEAFRPHVTFGDIETHTLRITAPVIWLWAELNSSNSRKTFRIRVRMREEPDGSSLILDLLEAVDPGSRLFMELAAKPLLGIPVITNTEREDEETILILVLRPVGDGFHERIGHINFIDDLDRLKKTCGWPIPYRQFYLR